jgi:hypothetical protein
MSMTPGEEDRIRVQVAAGFGLQPDRAQALLATLDEARREARQVKADMALVEAVVGGRPTDDHAGDDAEPWSLVGAVKALVESRRAWRERTEALATEHAGFVSKALDLFEAVKERMKHEPRCTDCGGVATGERFLAGATFPTCDACCPGSSRDWKRWDHAVALLRIAAVVK